MKLFNIFKKKEEAEKAEKPKKLKKEAEKAEKPKKLKNPKQIKGPSKVKVQKKKVFSEAYRILKPPHITEKASDLVKNDQYIFKVWPRANKIAIKKAVEGLYKVDVMKVQIIRIPSKKRRLGRIQGLRKGYKKAVVRIKEGQKIEILPR